MNPKRFLIFALCIVISTEVFAQSQSMDAALSKMADDLATQISANGNQKVTVLDFTDLQGNYSELGRYIAEELTVDLVMAKHSFAVLDRANLRSILAEHKLTAEGLVNPANAKKLGQFAGVGAMIVGTLVPMGTNIALRATIVTTDTAKIIGAAKAEFAKDSTVQQLLANPVAQNQSETGATGPQDLPAIIKTFGDLQVELQSLHIIVANSYSGSRKEFLLTLKFKDLNPAKSIWVAINTALDNTVESSLIDPNGNQFETALNRISGITTTAYEHGGFWQATQIQPNSTFVATMKFFSVSGVNAAPGTCRLQMEILLGPTFVNGFGYANVQNLVTKIQAN